MNLIVFDLEWNIGYAPRTFQYHGAELTLRGEIIRSAPCGSTKGLKSLIPLK